MYDHQRTACICMTACSVRCIAVKCLWHCILLVSRLRGRWFIDCSTQRANLIKSFWWKTLPRSILSTGMQRQCWWRKEHCTSLRGLTHRRNLVCHLLKIKKITKKSTNHALTNSELTNKSHVVLKSCTLQSFVLGPFHQVTNIRALLVTGNILFWPYEFWCSAWPIVLWDTSEQGTLQTYIASSPGPTQKSGKGVGVT